MPANSSVAGMARSYKRFTQKVNCIERARVDESAFSAPSFIR